MKRRAILFGLLINLALVAAAIYLLITSYDGQPGSTLVLMAMPPLAGCIAIVNLLVIAIASQHDESLSTGFRRFALIASFAWLALGAMAFVFG